MKKQGRSFFGSYNPLWKFLSILESEGWLFSKTQYILEDKIALSEKETSLELVNEAYHLDSSKILRYDLTIPWKLRLEGLTNQPNIIYRYQLGQVFRKGPRKGDRYRNFTQLDLEICSKKRYETEELLKKLKYLFGEELRLEFNDYCLFKQLTFKEKQELDKSSKGYPLSTELREKYNRIISDIKTKPILPFNGALFNPLLMRGQGIYENRVFEGYLRTNTQSILGGGEYRIKEYYCTGLSIGIEKYLES